MYRILCKVCQLVWTFLTQENGVNKRVKGREKKKKKRLENENVKRADIVRYTPRERTRELLSVWLKLKRSQ